MELPSPPAGVFPASSPAGAGSKAFPAGLVRLAAPIDPLTGETLSLFESADPVFSAVIAAFRTERGTGIAVQETGHRLETIRRSTAEVPDLAVFEARRVLGPFEKTGLISVQSIEAATGPSSPWQGRLRIQFTVIKTGQQLEVLA